MNKDNAAQYLPLVQVRPHHGGDGMTPLQRVFSFSTAAIVAVAIEAWLGVSHESMLFGMFVMGCFCVYQAAKAEVTE